MDFSEIFEDKTKYGTKLKTDEYEEQGKYLIVDQGQELIAGYTDKKDGFFSELPAIIFGDHTRILKYIDQPFYIGADGVKILRCKLQNANYRYLFYALKNVYIPNTGYNRHFKWLKQSSIKYPDSVTQNRIVKILDTVSGIIQLRKKELNQLDYLIKSRFIEMFGDPVTNSKGLVTRKGSEFFTLTNGKFVPEEKRRDEGIPAYGGNGISWYTDEILVAHDTIVVGRVGFQSGNVHFVTGPLWVTDNAMYISDFNKDQYDLRFLCALMEHIDFTRFQDAGDLKKITQKPFMQMSFIAPPIQQQKSFITFVEQDDKSKLFVKVYFILIYCDFRYIKNKSV